MSRSLPPAVRWVPEGEHAGIYLWFSRIQRWMRIDMSDTGCATSVAKEIPDAAIPMVTLDDVGEAIDLYRDALADTDARIPRDLHEVSRATALTELSDAADEPVWRPAEYDRPPAGGDFRNTP